MFSGNRRFGNLAAAHVPETTPNEGKRSESHSLRDVERRSQKVNVRVRMLLAADSTCPWRQG